MSEIDFSTFRQLAERRSDATLTVNMNTGDLRSRSNNVFNRVITWVRNKFQAPTTRQVEQQAAYNSFIRSMHASPRYDALEKESTMMQLSQDVRLGKPLTTRRIRQILTQLETPTVGSTNVDRRTYHENCIAANFMAGRFESDHLSRELREAIEDRPALRERNYSVRPEDQKRLSHRIYYAVMAATGDDPVNHPTHIVEYPEGARIAGPLVDEFLDTEEQRILAEEERIRLQETEAAATPEPVVEQDETVAARQPGARSRVAVWVRRLMRRSPPDSSKNIKSPTVMQALSQRLQPLNLPRELRSKVEGLIEQGQVTTQVQLRRQTNRNAAVWIEDNRLDKWYREGLRNADMPVPKRGTVPPELADEVVALVATLDGLHDYNDMKRLVRGKIRSWIDTQALSQRLEPLNLPRGIRSKVGRLIEQGQVTSQVELRHQTNRNAAVWIADNRLGRWYREMLEQANIPVPKRDRVPQELADEVVALVAGLDRLYDYNDMERLVREKIHSWFNQGA